MNPKAVLTDSSVCPSVAWAAVRSLFGDRLDDWEPDTFRIELKRRGVEATDGLMAKILGAMTIATTAHWVLTHDGLFAFALACDGIPANYEDVRHPTVEQLAWAMNEIARITPEPLTGDVGFDPDDVDAAVAVILIEEGFAIPPHELAFCEAVFEHLSHASKALREEITKAWEALDPLPLQTMRDIVSETDEDELGVQARRLCDVKLYIEEHVQKRARQNATLSD